MSAPPAGADGPPDPATSPAPPALPRLLFTGFELQDDQPDPTDTARAVALARRLAAAERLTVRTLTDAGLFEVVDPLPAEAARRLTAARASEAWLYRCNGCLPPVAAAAGASHLACGWVQRVSPLILNLNLLFRRADTDQDLLVRTVDLRGDQDESWRRGTERLLREVIERAHRLRLT